MAELCYFRVVHSIDNYIESLRDPLSVVARELRELILSSIDGVVEKYSYHMPVYHYHGLFCFMVFNRKAEGLDLSFLRGKDICELFPQLELRNRATAGSLLLYELKDIERLRVPEILTTAVAWQVEAKKLKLPLINRKR